MSLPYRISDKIVFRTLLTGEWRQRVGEGGVIESYVDLTARSISPDGDRIERTMDLLLRADPGNAFEDEDWEEARPVKESIIYIGDVEQQTFPLKPDQSLNLRVTRRGGIYFRGASPRLVLHVISAVLDV